MTALRPNRSMPLGVIIPELAYADVAQAADWLCRAFGFQERLRIGTHRAQLSFGETGLVLTRAGAAEAAPRGHGVMVRVADVDAHYAQAQAAGAQVLSPPTDYPFGERQYTAVDPAGHRWTFTQSIADVDPRDWGGEPRDGA